MTSRKSAFCDYPNKFLHARGLLILFMRQWLLLLFRFLIEGPKNRPVSWVLRKKPWQEALGRINSTGSLQNSICFSVLPRTGPKAWFSEAWGGGGVRFEAGNLQWENTDRYRHGRHGTQGVGE